MLPILLVGAGGCLGSIFRYVLSGWVHRILDNPWFPYGTLAVNITGSIAIGFLVGLADSRSFFTSEVRLFIFIGLLGGFTTFSSLTLETLSLARNTQFVAALANITAQMILGLLAVWLGNLLARLV